jgi:hypothetical protein
MEPVVLWYEGGGLSSSGGEDRFLKFVDFAGIVLYCTAIHAGGAPRGGAESPLSDDPWNLIRVVPA